jgi:hypothetical protein
MIETITPSTTVTSTIRETGTSTSYHTTVYAACPIGLGTANNNVYSVDISAISTFDNNSDAPMSYLTVNAATSYESYMACITNPRFAYSGLL